MKLLFEDKVMEMLFQLPKNVQKNFIDFKKKFVAGNSINSLNLEKLKNSKCDNLYSARINDDYRAIFFVINNSYSLVYIGNHVDSYRWAENHKINWNSKVQAMQITNFVEENVVIPNKNMDNVNESFKANITVNIDESLKPFAKFSDDDLLDIGVPQELVARIKSIMGIDDLEAIEKFCPDDVFEHIFNIYDNETSIEHIDSLKFIEDIKLSIREGLVKSEHIEDQMASINNRRHFVTVDDIDLQKILDGDFSLWQVYLHPSQSKLVNKDFKGSLKISGSAGTGKTIAAIHRLKYLATKYPNVTEHKILFTTYTKNLSNNLKSLIEKLNVKNEFYLLTNVDKLLHEFAFKHWLLIKGSSENSFPNIIDYNKSVFISDIWRDVLDETCSQFDEKFLMEEYKEVILYNDIQNVEGYCKQSRVGRNKKLSRKQKIDIWETIQCYRNVIHKRNYIDRLDLFNRVTNYLNSIESKPYEHIIVDEYQDFSTPELKFIRSLAKKGPNDLFLTGDPFQRIYKTKLKFADAGIDIRGRSKTLKVNYRTTEEIKKLAVSVLLDKEYDDFDDGKASSKGYISLIHGEKPKYIKLANEQEQAKYLVDFIKDIQNNEDNTIKLKEICIVTSSIRKNSIFVDYLSSFLKQENIPLNELKGENLVKDNAINLSTFYAIKGLEFKIIIIINPSSCEKNNSNLVDNFSVQRMQKINCSLLYVAMTRAQRQLLLIDKIDNASEFIDNNLNNSLCQCL